MPGFPSSRCICEVPHGTALAAACSPPFAPPSLCSRLWVHPGRLCPTPGWKKGMDVPTDIAIAYLLQCSFYGHSIYATAYMDTWRKDSVIMLLHHVVTLTLIAFSYAFR